MPDPFLDTNILLRHLMGDDPMQSPRARAVLARVERGELEVHTADTVVFETVYTLQRTYRLGKAAIRDQLLPILDMPGVILPGKRYFHRVFEIFVEANISFADAYHVVLMERLGLNEIISFDREFDRVAGITRIEP